MIILIRHATGSNVTKYRTRKNIAKTMISVIKLDDIVLIVLRDNDPRTIMREP
jgi:hypothetical protein